MYRAGVPLSQYLCGISKSNRRCLFTKFLYVTKTFAYISQKLKSTHIKLARNDKRLKKLNKSQISSKLKDKIIEIWNSIDCNFIKITVWNQSTETNYYSPKISTKY